MAQSVSCDIPEVNELNYALEILHRHGYMPVPMERYQAMMMFCAEHNTCGFYMVEGECEVTDH